MLRVTQLSIPDVLPHHDAIKSWGDNRHGYEAEFWEFQYEIHRYLGRVEQQELVARYSAILRNLHTLSSPDRHVIPIQSFLSSWFWYRKEHQTRLEFSLRGLEPPFDPSTAIQCSSPAPAPVGPHHPNSADTLFRYGQHRYMQAMVDDGSIRIGPASYYQTFEGDIARHDIEKHKHSYLPGAYTSILTQDGREHAVIGNVRRTASAPNYFILCLSCDWDQTLFEDFGANSCATISDPKAFASRLEVASRRELHSWHFHHGPVEYFDPYEMRRNQMFDAAMSKDFRFAYQREYRFLWINTGGIEAEGFKFLNTGSLADIANVHIYDATRL